VNLSLRTPRKKNILVAGLALSTVLGVGACSSQDESASAATSSSSSAEFGRPDPVASIPALSGGSTSVALDADFVAALESLGVAPGTVGDATVADGSVSFPITGGTVTVFDRDTGYRPYVQGTLLHEGSGLSLTAGGTTVELTNFTIDPGTPARLFGDVAVDGQQAVASAPLFDLNGSTLEPLSTDSEGNAVLEGTEVLLSPEAADLLNQTFGVTALEGGLLIGISTISVPTS
jgi:hypothetical protein